MRTRGPPSRCTCCAAFLPGVVTLDGDFFRCKTADLALGSVGSPHRRRQEDAALRRASTLGDWTAVFSLAAVRESIACIAEYAESAGREDVAAHSSCGAVGPTVEEGGS